MAVQSGGPITDVSGYYPWSKMVLVNGIRCLSLPAIGGATAVSDSYIKKVAKTIQLMFGSGGSIDSTIQTAVMQKMADNRTAQFIGYSDPSAYSPSIVSDTANNDYPGIDQTRNTNNNVDFIWEVTAGNQAIMEVTEHLLHTITVWGMHDVTGFSGKMNQLNQTSDLYNAMQQARTTNGSDGNPIYDTSAYSGDFAGDPDFRALLMREYYFQLVIAEWGWIDAFVDGASLAPEWNDSAKTSAGVQTYNALGHQLYLDTAAKVLTEPNNATMTSMFASGDNSGYQADYQPITATGGISVDGGAQIG